MMTATLELAPEELAAIAEARSLGIPLPRILHEWRSHRPPAGVTKTIGELIPELAEVKVRTGRSERYVLDMTRYLKRFSAFVGPETPVDQITADRIEDWFSACRDSPVSRASNLGRLGALFTYAKRKGFLREHPIDRVERHRIVRNEPAILRPAQVDRLLRLARERWPAMLPLLAVQIFSGLRPGEAQKLTWSKVNLEDSVIIVDAAVTKVRTRRAAPIHGAGVEWLRLTPPENRTGRVFPMSHATLRRYRRKLARTLGIAWPQDLLRHTAASALCAVIEDLGVIARRLGNSPRMLQIHYLSVLTPREGREILELRP